jgi:hypothetical protein
VGLNSLKSLNLTNGYPNKNKNKNKNNNNKNNKVKSKPLELRSRVKILNIFHASLLPRPMCPRIKSAQRILREYAYGTNFNERLSDSLRELFRFHYFQLKKVNKFPWGTNNLLFWILNFKQTN